MKHANWFNIFILLYILALFIFVISLFARLQSQINDVNNQLDKLNFVITVGERI